MIAIEVRNGTDSKTYRAALCADCLREALLHDAEILRDSHEVPGRLVEILKKPGDLLVRPIPEIELFASLDDINNELWLGEKAGEPSERECRECDSVVDNTGLMAQLQYVYRYEVALREAAAAVTSAHPPWWSMLAKLLEIHHRVGFYLE